MVKLLMQIVCKFLKNLIFYRRPNLNDTKKIKHHLYGEISVKKYFSAGDWLKKSKKKILTCLKTNKVPIIVGGTGLYFNTIIKVLVKFQILI